MYTGSEYRRVRAIIFTGLPDHPIYRNIARKIHAKGPGFVESGRSLISSSFAYNSVLENSISEGSREHGIYWTNHQDGAIIRNNIVFNAGGAALQFNADPETFDVNHPFKDGSMSNNLVENNIFYNSSTVKGAVLNLAGVEDSIFRNNIIYGANMRQGIACWDDGYGNQFGCKGNEFYHNVIDSREALYHGIAFRNGSINNKFKNNIVLRASGKDAIAIDEESNQGMEIDYNIYSPGVLFEGPNEQYHNLENWRSLFRYDTHSIISPVNDLFVDINARDYHLSGNSSAIDVGINVGVTHDFDGNSRPVSLNPDIGAYEYGSGSFTFDLNGDDITDIKDAILCLNIILGTENRSEIIEKADLNNDNDVNMLDLQYIINIISEKSM